MNAERDDIPDIIDALRAELAAVEPSPRFVTGVRERVEQQSSRRLPGLRFALAAAAVGCVAMGAYLVRPGEGVQPLSSVSVETSAPVAAPIPMAPAPASQPRPRVQAPAPRRAAAPVAVVVADTGPNLEVITNQPEVIRRMRSRFSTRAILDPSVASDGIEIGEITVTPIVVNEIEVPVMGGVVIKKGTRLAGSDESARSTR